MREQLLYYVVKYQADWLRVENAIQTNEKFETVEGEEKFITILDDCYPKQLLRLQRPPWLLFYRGNINLLTKKMVAVVGSREVSSYGLNACRWLVDEIKSHVCIVSGLAKGIDACAHKQALFNDTIAVVGSGLNVVYPKVNEDLWKEVSENHLILSEYPRDTLPLGHHFLIRNRIIAGLCNSLVVCEAKIRSGSQRTVGDALEIGLTVFAIPHPIDSRTGTACNRLIGEGAHIMSNIRDIDLLLEIS